MDMVMLDEIIAAYKSQFERIDKEERYKWEAVKCFQDNWNIDAEDFTAMLKKSLDKSENLLTSSHYYARKMIQDMSAKNPSYVKNMFISLYDESKGLPERVTAFRNAASKFIADYKEEKPVWKNHYQDMRAVAVYLVFKYPQKYYLFKSSMFQEFANRVSYTDVLRQGTIEMLISFNKMCDEIHNYILQDKELLEMSKKRLDANCDQDSEYRMLTMDIVYFGHKYEDGKVTYLNEIIASLKELGGTASLRDINKKISKRGKLPSIKTNPNWMRAVSATLQRYCKETQSYIDGNDDIFYSVNGLGHGVWGLKPQNDEKFLSHPYWAEKYFPENETAEADIYTKADFLEQVYMSEDMYDSIKGLLMRKHNIILQGAPGVGKTFAAKRLAYSIIGSKDEDKIKFVQFHQNYSYEDFIMGYKPDGNGFKLQTGVFYNFCEKANANPNAKYFFIIDEINRGNMSKIFGELLMLIEHDYRGESITLAYDKSEFSVPENLYIIGMMNTADRSLAMIDYALRRRFSFVPMLPAFDKEGFKAYQDKLNDSRFNALIDKVKRLNKEIADDPALGDGFQIGHSYFCNQNECSKEWLSEIVEYDIIPLLTEYWFDNKEMVEIWSKKLSGVLDD